MRGLQALAEEGFVRQIQTPYVTVGAAAPPVGIMPYTAPVQQSNLGKVVVVGLLVGGVLLGVVMLSRWASR